MDPKYAGHTVHHHPLQPKSVSVRSTCMAVTADAVLATAPRMFAMITVSAVMVSRLQVTSGWSKDKMEEVELGV